MQVTKNGICYLYQNGNVLAWNPENGVAILEKDGLFFKDLARAGVLLPYEDWRLDAWTRAQDLASRLTVEEIAGLMLYSPHQFVPGAFGPFVGTYGGKPFQEAGMEDYALSDQQRNYLTQQHIRHILLGYVKDARTAARWNNTLQKLAESLPFGIPVNLASDPRHGARGTSGVEFRNAGSDVSKWPEGIGFTACFDPEIVRRFAEDASREYRALGICTALGPQLDLATDPRWMRLCDTFGEDVQTTVRMAKAYCEGMQTTKSTGGWGAESVNTMVKHWPGGGTGEGGRDAHYAFGQFAVYPGGNQAAHLKPFTEGAFCLDGGTEYAAAVMPYYTVSWNYNGGSGENVGNAYNQYLIRDLLRKKFGYRGVVCTDWNVTQDLPDSLDSFGSRSYGMQKHTEAERHLIAIMNGVDQFGGNCDIAPILEAYRLGCKEYGEDVMRKRMELSASRLLKNIFHCGLFENPYLDPEESAGIVGCEEFVRHGFDAQHKSVVLLKNRGNCLPLQKGQKLYVPHRFLRERVDFLRNPLPASEIDPIEDSMISKYGVRVFTPEEADAALIFIESPSCNCYSEENGYLPIMLQYRPYTAKLAREQSIAGGDPREESVNRSYCGKTAIAYNERDLDLILETRKAMGTKPIIVIAYMPNPIVMAEFEHQADSILAEFGVSREAVLDILFGECAPTGRLPFQLPANMDTVEIQQEDVAFDMQPYVDELGNRYDFGFGLSYEER